MRCLYGWSCLWVVGGYHWSWCNGYAARKGIQLPSIISSQYSSSFCSWAFHVGVTEAQRHRMDVTIQHLTLCICVQHLDSEKSSNPIWTWTLSKSTFCPLTSPCLVTWLLFTAVAAEYQFVQCLVMEHTQTQHPVVFCTCKSSHVCQQRFDWSFSQAELRKVWSQNLETERKFCLETKLQSCLVASKRGV